MRRKIISLNLNWMKEKNKNLINSIDGGYTLDFMLSLFQLGSDVLEILEKKKKLTKKTKNKSKCRKLL